MAVKMRLMRMGKKHSPFYRVVVIDGRAPRDGRYIDLLGRYDPREEPSVIEIDTDKAIDWLKKGAQPTEAVRKLLEISGAMSRYKVAAGKIHTVAAKAPAAPAPEQVEDTPAEEQAVPAGEAEEPTVEETQADVGDDAATEEE
ncbi:MAG TPA: 30S ribosomal protein S16 [Acidimicrobiia bacterium]|nr:30S ribosomal protein S16 [Acidimicrobiia bacterium]